MRVEGSRILGRNQDLPDSQVAGSLTYGMRPTFKDMKSWTGRTGHDQLRSFPMGMERSSSSKTLMKSRSGRSWLVKAVTLRVSSAATVDTQGEC